MSTCPNCTTELEAFGPAGWLCATCNVCWPPAAARRHLSPVPHLPRRRDLDD
jgi:hypothetical protein